MQNPGYACGLRIPNYLRIFDKKTRLLIGGFRTTWTPQLHLCSAEEYGPLLFC